MVTDNQGSGPSARIKRIETLIEDHAARWDPFKLSEGQVKMGIKNNCLVVGPDLVATNIQTQANPGFTFSSSGSHIRPGKLLYIETEFANVLYDGGTKSINPMGDVVASSTTDPAPTVVPRIPPILSIAGVVRKVLEPLRAVLG